MGTAVLKKKRGAAKTSQVARARTSAPKPPMTQMNVRIEADLKERGDRAFERIGSSPSEMVRALWRYASRHANDPKACNQLIEMLNEEPAEKSPDPLASMAEARNAIDSFLETWGLSADASAEHTSLAEHLALLREEEALSSLREQGYAL